MKVQTKVDPYTCINTWNPCLRVARSRWWRPPGLFLRSPGVWSGKLPRVRTSAWVYLAERRRKTKWQSGTDIRATRRLFTDRKSANERDVDHRRTTTSPRWRAVLLLRRNGMRAYVPRFRSLIALKNLSSPLRSCRGLLVQWYLMYGKQPVLSTW